MVEAYNGSACLIKASTSVNFFVVTSVYLGNGFSLLFFTGCRSDIWRAVQVRDALTLAYNSHDGQMRKSGEKYITHPVEVTRILAELRMDHESLIAGLLHDTVEDTKHVTLEEIGVRPEPVHLLDTTGAHGNGSQGLRWLTKMCITARN